MQARGSERYAVNVKPKTVEWASQNMLVLGIIVIAGLALHFANFWYKMQFAEIIGVHDLGAFGPTDGAAYIRETFGCPVFTVLYLIWLAGFMVPPDSRILERFADIGLEQQNLVRALEDYW